MRGQVKILFVNLFLLLTYSHTCVAQVTFEASWSSQFVRFIVGLLRIRPGKRTTTFSSIIKTRQVTWWVGIQNRTTESTLCIIIIFVCNSFMSNVPLEDLVSKNMSPPFIPRGDVLHCDPTHELEEVCSIMEKYFNQGQSIPWPNLMKHLLFI